MSALDPAWLLDPGLIADPYPYYAALRRADPVHRNELSGAWFLLRYRDVAPLLRDPRLSSGAIFRVLDQLPASWRDRSPTLRSTLENWILFLDRPRHTRLRAAVAGAFTQRMDDLEGRIAGWVHQLLDAAEQSPDGAIDLIARLAMPLPGMTLASLLGGRVEDREQYQSWGHDVGQVLGKLERIEADLERAEASMIAMDRYMAGILAARARAPADDLVSGMLAGRASGSGLTDEEIRAMAGLLFAAAADNTTNLIGNGLFALLGHPAALGRLRTDPSLAPAAVEELLRFDSPSQMTARVALEDIEVGDRTLLAGDLINLVLGAANRDPEMFNDPDTLDLGRPDNRHLSFGQGIHFCVGAQVARLAARVAITEVLTRYPALRLAEGARFTRYRSLAFRGLRSLSVQIRGP